MAGELKDGAAPALGVARRAAAVDELLRTPQDAAVAVPAVGTVGAVGGRAVVVEAPFGGAAVGRGGGELRAHVT